MNSLKVSHPTRKVNAHIKLPASKSESNRVLILKALSGLDFEISNLSEAGDTKILQQILASNDAEVNVADAGTAMRFLTAYYCTTNQHKIVSGSERMKERTIAHLANALIDLGFDVRYIGEEGYPPLEIFPVNLSRIENEVSIKGNVSSQFTSALLLIAPFLENGLKVNFTSSIASQAYIEMTLSILKHFGVEHTWQDDSITIHKTELKNVSYHVGADWTAASYWYAIAFLADKAEIFLEGLNDDWTQGDREVAEWMKRFGVATKFVDGGALLTKTALNYPHMMKLNFRNNPDLAQTFAVMFAAKNVYATFSGIESLKIKETDRIHALREELKKLNTHFEYSDMYDFYQLKGEFQLPAKAIATYNDHRMAMSFAALGVLGEVEIDNPTVVEKSYPGFWDDLKSAGFVLS
jgi:3-phosphoshikimate 1-carboxyvinyltransferase